MISSILSSHPFEAFWFFLPAGIANMTPPIANKIPYLNKWITPLDMGRSYRGVRIFGANKTWRGLLTGVVLAGTVRCLQLNGTLTSKVIVLNFLFGMLMGAGALFGDAIESFFKRRAGVKSGNTWFPFDQIDYIIGGLLVTYALIEPPTSFVLWVFAIYFGLHLLVSYIGFLMGFKDKPI